MATLDELSSALRNADKAGDTRAAKRFADEIRKMRGAKDSYDETYFAQGTSGINEGIGNTLGAPVDLMNAALGLGAKGINAVAGTDLKVSDKPFLGSEYINDWQRSAGSIRPESQDSGKQIVRRIGEEVGAAVVPGLGAMGKAQQPVRTAIGITASALGSGAGAATAEQLAPGNPYAELAGQVIGGGIPALGSMALAKRSADKALDRSIPSIDEARAAKDAAYQRVDDMGVQYAPETVDQLRQGIRESLQAGEIDDILNPRATRAASRLDERFSGPQTLTQLDKARQFVRNNVVDIPGQKVEGRFAGMMTDEIDDFIDSAPPMAGTSDDASDAIRTARSLDHRLRKADAVQSALTKAEHRAGSTYTGGNIDNAQRQNIRAILDDPKKVRGFSSNERDLMERIVMGTPGQNAARQIGKLSPSGNGLQQALAIGATAYNPAMGVLPGVGMLAKGLADRKTRKNVEELVNTILAGGVKLQRAPLVSDDMRKVINALLMAQGANALAD